ncbi:MAG: CHAT domain-containing protein [Betaproteobacteria bacterium]|nr:CHAT domain-containing protein [Betaproteobacteria bacterium]
MHRFYRARGEAAGRLGLVEQQLTDLRKALDLTPPGGDRWGIYVQIGTVEAQAGNVATAVKMWNEGPNFAAHPGQKVIAWQIVTRMRASIGDLAGAREALKQVESALWASEQDRNFWRWQADDQLGHLEAARGFILRLEGKHAEAEAAFRRAIAQRYKFGDLLVREGMRVPPMGQVLRTAVLWEYFLAGTLLEQGKLAEAEAAVRNALSRVLGHFGRYSPETGQALVRLANVIFEQGRFHEAASVAQAAVDIYEKIGAAMLSDIVVSARRTIGRALVADGKYAEADRAFAALREGLQRDPASAEQLSTDAFAWVIALVRLGRAAEAVDQARRIYHRQRERYGDAFYRVFEARGYYALALAAAARYEEALREFRAAIPALLAAASERVSEEGFGLHRTIRLTTILNAYVELLGHFAEKRVALEGLDPVAEAFLIADVARGSSVQRALAAASARAAIREPELARLAREEQDSGRRISSLTGILVDLLARRPEQQLPQVIAAIRRDIDELRKTRSTVIQDIAKRFPDYANLIDPKPVSLDTARKMLRTGEVLIALYGTADRTFVWAIPQQGEVRFHSAALGREQRDRIVATLRRALDIGDTALERFPKFDLEASHKLYAELLAPLEDAWARASSLLIVPHGSLAQLPFGVLVTRPAPIAQGALPFEGYKSTAWLLRRAAITQLPSVNTLVSLRNVARTRVPSKPFIGFGDPVFGAQQVASATPGAGSMRLRSAPFDNSDAARKAISVRLAQLRPLPDTAEELEAIAKTMGAVAQQDVFVGVRASEQNVMSAELAERRVIAFATHGLVPGDLDGLTQPALALSNPQVTGEKDADGLLTMEEILGLKLNADWVVLSACNTAAAEGVGGEAVSGLGRAFFYSGARALLVSNWPVETVSAKLLTTDIFRRQAIDSKLARAEALRQAMLHLMENGTAKDREGKPLYTYAHPMFWAPFSLIGDGN